MKPRDQMRAHVLTRVLEGTMPLKEAAGTLKLSDRQVRRLKGRLRREGPAGLVHGNRGRVSPRRTAPAVLAAVVAHYRETYWDANVQHFTELLGERETLHMGVATVRRALRAAGLVSPRTRRVPKHRARRERRSAEGLLLQLDGSPFRWLGPDRPRWSLLAAIDDATGDPVAAVFREQEDAAGYLERLRQVVTTRGIPAAVYRDRHGIFEVTRHTPSSLEEELAGTRFPTQVGRLLAELGIASIPAYSPQAKGRVERHWRTQQDRLAVELRLAGVRTLAEANAFLPGYLARYRARFTVAPRYAEPAYVPVDPTTDLDRLFCFKYQRKVAPDNTLRFAGAVLQLLPGPDRLSYARAVVEVQERLDGSLAVYHQGQLLVVRPAPPEPVTLRARHASRPRAPGAEPPVAHLPPGTKRAGGPVGPPARLACPPHPTGDRPEQATATSRCAPHPLTKQQRGSGGSPARLACPASRPPSVQPEVTGSDTSADRFTYRLGGQNH